MRTPTLNTTASGGLCSRLHNRLRAWYLRWLLKDLRRQLDKLEEEMGEATAYVILMARAHRHAPWLQAHRQGMRARHELLAQRWLAARQDLDNLERAL